MFKINIAIVALFLSTLMAPAQAAVCTGADPALHAVSVKGVSPNGGTNVYHLGGSVVNAGHRAQTSNALEFVDIFRDGEKMDSIGIPPLKPGQSYAFRWTFERSQDAGNNTTTLVFRIRMVQPAGNAQNCSAGNDQTTVTF